MNEDEFIEQLRDYLRANMLDGNEAGIYSAPAKSLLDEVVELVKEFCIEADLL